MKLTISGDPGAGKTTVAKIIANKLKLKHYYIGGLRRETARKKGLTIEEFNKLGEEDPSTDKEVDDYQAEIGKKENDFIMEGRTSYFLIPCATSIYLTVDLEEGAKRIFKDLKTNDKRNEKTDNLSIEKLKERIIERKKSDDYRYKKYYDKDVYDLSQYDILLDTTFLSKEEVVEQLLIEIKKKRRN